MKRKLKKKSFEELMKDQGYVFDEDSDILIHEDFSHEKKQKKGKK